MGMSTIKSKLKRGLALTQKESGDLWEYIRSLEKQQCWIPCSKKLLDEQRTIGKYIFSENVLGTEGYTIRRAYYNYTTKEWFDGNEEMEWTEITHWMPLPEETHKVESEVKPHKICYYCYYYGSDIRPECVKCRQKFDVE